MLMSATGDPVTAVGDTFVCTWTAGRSTTLRHVGDPRLNCCARRLRDQQGSGRTGGVTAGRHPIARAASIPRPPPTRPSSRHCRPGTHRAGDTTRTDRSRRTGHRSSRRETAGGARPMPGRPRGSPRSRFASTNRITPRRGSSSPAAGYSNVPIANVRGANVRSEGGSLVRSRSWRSSSDSAPTGARSGVRSTSISTPGTT